MEQKLPVPVHAIRLTYIIAIITYFKAQNKNKNVNLHFNT